MYGLLYPPGGLLLKLPKVWSHRPDVTAEVGEEINSGMLLSFPICFRVDIGRSNPSPVLDSPTRLGPIPFGFNLTQPNPAHGKRLDAHLAQYRNRTP